MYLYLLTTVQSKPRAGHFHRESAPRQPCSLGVSVGAEDPEVPGGAEDPEAPGGGGVHWGEGTLSSGHPPGEIKCLLW